MTLEERQLLGLIIHSLSALSSVTNILIPLTLKLEGDDRETAIKSLQEVTKELNAALPKLQELSQKE